MPQGIEQLEAMRLEYNLQYPEQPISRIANEQAAYVHLGFRALWDGRNMPITPENREAIETPAPAGVFT